MVEDREIREYVDQLRVRLEETLYTLMRTFLRRLTHNRISARQHRTPVVNAFLGADH